MGFPSIFRVNKGNCLQYPSALPYLVCFQTGLVFHGFPFSCRIMIHHDPWWYMIHDDPSAANTIRNHPATPNKIFFTGYISGEHTQKCKTAHYYLCIVIYSFSHQPVARQASYVKVLAGGGASGWRRRRGVWWKRVVHGLRWYPPVSNVAGKYS